MPVEARQSGFHRFLFMHVCAITGSEAQSALTSFQLFCAFMLNESSAFVHSSFIFLKLFEFHISSAAA